MKEKHLQTQLIEYLTLKGYKCININSGKIQTKQGYIFQGAPAGTSDILACSPSGQFTALEIKLPKRKKLVTKLQQDFLDNIKERGGIAGVVTSIEDINELLEIYD